MTTLEVARIINFVFDLIALVGCIIVWRRYKMHMMIAPITWLVMSMVFWVCRMFGIPSDTALANLWSSVIHLQACVLIISALIIFRQERKT
jgi:hypothetical protein